MISRGINNFTKLQKLTCFLKPAIVFIFSLAFIFKAYSQKTYIINTSAVNLHSKASANSPVIGKATYGDTVLFHYEKGNWLNVSLKNRSQGFLLNKFVTPIIEIIPVESISTFQQIDMSSWTFSFLFTATFKYFLLITAIVLLALLLIYYLK